MNKLFNELNLLFNDPNSNCKILKKITIDELTTFEEENKVILPKEYKNILLKFGAFELFSDDYSAGIELLLPQDVKQFSASIFENYGNDLYPSIFLAINIPATGWFGGFKLNEIDEHNFSIFFSDVEPDYWLDEATFTNFIQWLERVVMSKGQELLL